MSGEGLGRFSGVLRMYESWLGIGKGSLWTKAQRHEIMGYIRGTLRNVFELCITSVHYYHFAAYFQFVSFVQLNYKLLQGRAMSNLNSISLLQPANVCKCNTELLFTGDRWDRSPSRTWFPLPLYVSKLTRWSIELVWKQSDMDWKPGDLVPSSVLSLAENINLPPPSLGLSFPICKMQE